MAKKFGTPAGGSGDLSSLDSPVRPSGGLAGREISRHKDLLGDHLDELKLFILQWSKAHEHLFTKQQADRPLSAVSFSALRGEAAHSECVYGAASELYPSEVVSQQRDASPRTKDAANTDSREDTDDSQQVCDTETPGTHTKVNSVVEFIEDSDNDKGSRGPSEPAKRGSAVFMNAHEISEATQMIGFSKKTQGRVSRHMSGLQNGLDAIMPSQGRAFQETVSKFEKSSFFEFLCFVVITINTAGLSVSTQRNANGDEEGKFLEDLELACCLFYCFELMVRLVVHQFHFFYRGPVAWNVFDCVLVILAIQEQATKNDEVNGGNMSYLRTTRILKVLKVLRIIRLLRFFKELRLIIGGIMASVKTLLWTVLLIAIVTFMFSICFVQGMTGLGLDSEGNFACESWKTGCVSWATIHEGMVVLFMSSTGGIDWREAANPLLESSPGYYVAFLFYIFVFTFVIQNTITSLFVECLFEKQNSDEAFLISDRLERRAEYSAKIQDLYGYMDSDRDGQVTYNELCDNLHDPRMLAFAESLEMELTDLRLFFKVLTGGGKNAVDIETFVVGCIKLRGTAKSIDLVDITRNMNKQTALLEPIQDQLRELRRMVEARPLGKVSGHNGVAPRDHSRRQVQREGSSGTVATFV